MLYSKKELFLIIIQNYNFKIQAMKAIETVYKGYHFRSRLEARWAVFFDSLGWNWKYEAEGYELKCGRYLPDFYFPDIPAYGEVKPISPDEKELDKCRELKEKSGHDVFLLVGEPDFKTYTNLGFFSDGSDDEVIFIPKGQKYYPFHWGSWYWDSPDKIQSDFKGTSEAVYAARSARFEFGQSGATI
jgi:hypothetical protein